MTTAATKPRFTPLYHALSRPIPSAAFRDWREYLLEQMIQCMDATESLIEGLSTWLMKVCAQHDFMDYCIQLEAELTKFSKAIHDPALAMDLDYCGMYSWEGATQRYYRYVMLFEWVNTSQVTFEFRFTLGSDGVLKSARVVWGDETRLISLPATPTALPKISKPPGPPPAPDCEAGNVCHPTGNVV
jgi:hypothetical protein